MSDCCAETKGHEVKVTCRIEETDAGVRLVLHCEDPSAKEKLRKVAGCCGEKAESCC